jgi:hypothetical protein
MPPFRRSPWIANARTATCRPQIALHALPVAAREPNTICEEYKAKFWPQGGLARFCSESCKDDHEKLAAKYAKPAAPPYNGLAAFPEGRER